MSSVHSIRFCRSQWLWLALVMNGCTVGPDFQPPAQTSLPTQWSSIHSGSDELKGNPESTLNAPGQWWTVFADPVLDRLQLTALKTNMDVRMAALRVAQSRMQRRMVAAQWGPQMDASGGVSRQRLSEQGANARMLGTLPIDSRELIDAMSDPFTLYQAGFDASWELDLWGRIRRSVEAADASIEAQQAIQDETRLLVVSEVARNYFELRGVQQQIYITEKDIQSVQESLQLIQIRADGGLVDDMDVVQQRSQLAEMEALLPQLQAQETFLLNQIVILLGMRPGELNETLKSDSDALTGPLPNLQLGIPSDVVRRRPDIRAAEAQLHSATAHIGVAVADLYPSIRLGASFGYESFKEGRFGDWGSRQWSIGPAFHLPIFDRGRRRATIQLRDLEHQEAAIGYQQTVLKAWQEVDDALSRYAAQRRRHAQLAIKAQSSRDAYEMATARYQGGLTNFIVLLDTQRVHLQSRRDLVESQTQMRMALVAIYKAIGGGDLETAQWTNPMEMDSSTGKESIPEHYIER